MTLFIHIVLVNRIKEIDIVLERYKKAIQNEDLDTTLYAHRYAIHFDILPNITYLNQDLVAVIADLLQLFHQFPDSVWISQQSVDEGLDFCRVNFWVFSDSSAMQKQFSIWFQALFREAEVTDVLVRLVSLALEESDGIEIELTDWTRLNVLETDIQHAIQTEQEKNNIDM